MPGNSVWIVSIQNPIGYDMACLQGVYSCDAELLQYQTFLSIGKGNKYIIVEVPGAFKLLNMS